MARTSVLSGQFHGTVDWVTSNGREVGMYLHNKERQTRCILHGAEIEKLTSNKAVEKGMAITGFGELAARCITVKGELTPEVLCSAARVVVEPAREQRVRGAAYANLKGVVMHWDPERLMLKTFFNHTEPGLPERVLCSVHLVAWVRGLPEESVASLKASLRAGREYTVAALVDSDYYRSGALEVPVLRLLPLDFRLQG
jgi:hypothetical protein